MVYSNGHSVAGEDTKIGVLAAMVAMNARRSRTARAYDHPTLATGRLPETAENTKYFIIILGLLSLIPVSLNTLWPEI